MKSLTFSPSSGIAGCQMKGRTLQEWNLLREDEKESYDNGVAALRSRLDPGSKTMAAQDFRHASPVRCSL